MEANGRGSIIVGRWRRVLHSKLKGVEGLPEIEAVPVPELDGPDQPAEDAAHDIAEYVWQYSRPVSFDRTGSPAGAVAGCLRVSLLKEIRHKPLHETTDETDHQYHLPSQAAAADIGVSDRDTGCWLAWGWASGCTTAVLMGTTVDSGLGSAHRIAPRFGDLGDSPFR